MIPPASAQLMPHSGVMLPEVGAMISTSHAFTPTIIRAVTVKPENPFEFDFIVDHGDQNLAQVELKDVSTKLVRYFLAALTVPEKELWVNLSPYEKERIIPESLSQTEMGRDLLSQDYLLKQLTSSLMFPDNALGGEFWQKIYQQAFKKFGKTDIPTDVFNKVWIAPKKAVIYEHGKTAFVVESKLQVMLEEDYLAIQEKVAQRPANKDTSPISDITHEIIKSVIIPVLEEEVNEGENFANLRQIYNSLILATWYKKNLQQSLLSQVYADKNKVKGIDLADPKTKESIYNQYVESFKKGVFNFIKEEYEASTQQISYRKYFSGGIVPGDFALATDALETIRDEALLPHGARQFLETIITQSADPDEMSLVTIGLLDSAIVSDSDSQNKEIDDLAKGQENKDMALITKVPNNRGDNPTVIAPHLVGEKSVGLVAFASFLKSNGNWGMGDLGSLEKLNELMALLYQDIMQHLPLGPSTYNHSPFSLGSSFLLDPYLIDHEGLLEEIEDEFEGDLPEEVIYFLGEKLGLIQELNRAQKADHRGRNLKIELVGKVYHSLKAQKPESDILKEFQLFRDNFRAWIDYDGKDKDVISLLDRLITKMEDHLLNNIIKEEFNTEEKGWRWDWRTWTKNEEEKAIQAWDRETINKEKKKREDQLERDLFIQFMVLKKWRQNQKSSNVQMITDIPIAADITSGDVRENPGLFYLYAINGYLRQATQGVAAEAAYAIPQYWFFSLLDWAHKEARQYLLDRFIFNLVVLDSNPRYDHALGFGRRYEHTSMGGNLGWFAKIEELRNQVLTENFSNQRQEAEGKFDEFLNSDLQYLFDQEEAWLPDWLGKAIIDSADGSVETLREKILELKEAALLDFAKEIAAEEFRTFMMADILRMRGLPEEELPDWIPPYALKLLVDDEGHLRDDHLISFARHVPKIERLQSEFHEHEIFSMGPFELVDLRGNLNEENVFHLLKQIPLMGKESFNIFFEGWGVQRFDSVVIIDSKNEMSQERMQQIASNHWDSLYSNWSYPIEEVEIKVSGTPQQRGHGFVKQVRVTESAIRFQSPDGPGFLKDYMFPVSETLAPRSDDQVRFGYFNYAPTGMDILSDMMRLAQEHDKFILLEMLGAVVDEAREMLKLLNIYDIYPVIWGLDEESDYNPANHPLTGQSTGSVHDSPFLKERWENELSDQNGLEEKKTFLNKAFGPGQWSEKDLNSFTDKVHDKILEMIYLSRARLSVLAMGDVLGYGEDKRINNPNSDSGNWASRSNTSVEDMITAAKDILALARERSDGEDPLQYLMRQDDPFAALKEIVAEKYPDLTEAQNFVVKTLGLTAKAKKASQKDYENGDIVNVAPEVGGEAHQFRRIDGHPFNVDAFIYGSPDHVSIVVENSDGSTETIEMDQIEIDPMSFSTGVPSQITHYSVSLTIDKIGIYKFHIKTTTGDENEKVSETGRLTLVPEDANLNPFQPEEFILNDPNFMNSNQGIVAEEGRRATDDNAMPVDQEEVPGGINLDPAMMSMSILRDENNIPLSVESQPVMNLQIQGLFPVILKISPILNLRMTLGFKREEFEVTGEVVES